MRILLALAVVALASKVVPMAVRWIVDRFVVGDLATVEKKSAAWAVKIQGLKESSRSDPQAARKLRAIYRKEISDHQELLKLRDKELESVDPGMWQGVEGVQALTRRNLEELESQMRSRGWLEAGASGLAAGEWYTRERFMEDLFTCGAGAAVIALIASVPLGLWLLVAAYQHLSHSPEAPPIKEMIGTPITVFVGYIVAATGVTLSLFLLRPLRRWFLGWPLSGSAIAVAIYGGIGLAGTLAYRWFGINLFDSHSPEQAGKDLPFLIAICAGLGGPLGIYFWFKEGRDM